LGNSVLRQGCIARMEASKQKEFALERSVAIAAVIRASLLCQRVQKHLVSEETIEKKDRSPVTVADFASQALIISELTERFPELPFVAEESSKVLKQNDEVRRKVLHEVQAVMPSMRDEATLLATIDKGKRERIDASTRLWWTLDPVDGTLGFLRRGQYVIALALMQDYKPVLGVLGCPALPRKGMESKDPGCLLVAVKGQGAFVRGLDTDEEEPIRVADIDDTSKAVFTESFEASHSSHSASAKIAALLGVTAEPIRIDSQCKYGLVARGDASIYLRLTPGNYVERIWDHAAGTIVVEEAGGVVTDQNGERLDFSHGRGLDNNKGIVVANGKIHGQVLEVVKRVCAEDTK